MKKKYTEADFPDVNFHDFYGIWADYSEEEKQSTFEALERIRKKSG